MILTYKQFHLINFPIFALPSDNVHVTDGILFHENLVVDDRNQLGDTLGIRRLQTPHKLLRLRYIREDIGQLISSKKRVFVDNKGYCFIYERTKFCKIKSYKIVKATRKDVGTVLKVLGLNFPILVDRPPPPGKEWVGLVEFNGKPWLPYEYSEYYCTPFRKKI